MSDEELDLVKEEIVKSIKSIENYCFNLIPDYFTCKYCSYRNLCDDVN